MQSVIRTSLFTTCKVVAKRSHSTLKQARACAPGFSNTQWAPRTIRGIRGLSDPLLPATPSRRTLRGPTRSVYPSTLEDAHTQRTRRYLQMQTKTKISDPRRFMILVKLCTVYYSV